MVDPAGAFLTSPASRYTITGGSTATVAGRKMNVIDLIPKAKNGMFQKARLWIDASDNMLRQFEVTDINGLTRMITITELTANPNIPASAFKFTPPRNVRIVDPSAMNGM
jgi:outer membrane lipoprotein-sorting protein